MTTALFVVWLVFAVFAVRGGAEPVPDPSGDAIVPQPASMMVVSPASAATDLVVAALKVKLKKEHERYLAAHQRVRQLTRTLAHRSSTREAIDLACAIYGNCSTLWSLATCESGLSPYAKNPHSDASGLLQFMPSTFAHTPFGRFSIWSPYANALAGGWMLARGRRGEWVC